MRTSWGLGLIAAGMVACYAPDPQPGASCDAADEDACPSGQQCETGFCRVTSGEPHGAQTDAGTDAPPPIGCETADRCITSTTLGTISGDTNHQVLTASGQRAAWFRVRVTEDDDTVAGRTVRVAAKLKPPASADFEVRIYVNVTTDVLECATNLGTATTSSGVKQTRVAWGEGAIPNGLNDSRDVVIEVRPITGVCAAGQSWTLAIEGNWN